MAHYEKPTTLNEALALLGEGPRRILAGGTDFYPAQANRTAAEPVLDINALSGLRGIAATDTHFIIGSLTTWSAVASADFLPGAFEALRQAAREVGSVQIQNCGTVAGNLCNASPAADGVPALLVLDAEVELTSRFGARTLPLPNFILGNRRTALAPGEIVTAVRVPREATSGTSSFFKLGSRRYLVISIAMAAVRTVVRNGLIEQCAVSVGACSPVAARLPELEASLIGTPAKAVRQHVEPGHFDALQPIDDVRGSRDYRRLAAREIVIRALEAACLSTDTSQGPVAA